MSFDAWIGRTEERDDVVWPPLAGRLAATLGEAPAVDGVLPPLGHWMLFQDWPAPAALGPDGHARRGGFLPPVDDLPHRMWAGGRLEFIRPLRAGDTVRRTSTIAAIAEKHGRAGRLVFVTVRHAVDGPAGPALVEEQDIVYRGDAPARTPEPAEAPPPGALVEELVPDAVMLFRYSALTGNAHRIHYDIDYARDVEAYPGLVVHGPLQATWLARLALRVMPGRTLARFAFRAHRPVFHGRVLRLEGWAERDAVRLRTLDPAGAVAMSAEAVLA